jgi:hypothetical protein
MKPAAASGYEQVKESFINMPISHCQPIVRRSAVISAFLVIMVVVTAAPIYAGQQLEESRIPEELDAGINYLYGLVQSEDDETDFDPRNVGPILDFVIRPAKNDPLFYMDEIDGASSAYYGFDIPVDLHRFLKYSYNPRIPDALFCPSSIRFSTWRKVNGTQNLFPKLWTHLPDPKRPVMVKGLEHMENTPDLSSGAFFSYDLLRAVILFRHNGNNVLLSVSKQTGLSEVGKKGLIIGEDSAWNYLYTDLEGLTKPGLGWVRSQIYDSFSIIVYYEQEGRIRCGAFKWLNAGWAGINFVKKSHIYSGLERFAQAYHEIFSKPLPEPEEIESFFSGLNGLSPQQINQIAEMRFEMQKNDYGNLHISEQKQIFECLDGNTCRDDAWNNIVKSGVTVEYMKYILGLENPQRLHRLLGQYMPEPLSGTSRKSQ